MPMKRITVDEASKIIGITPQALRLGIVSGSIPVGNCFKNRGRKKTYLVYEELVNEFMRGK